MPAEAPCQTDYDFIFPHTKERRANLILSWEQDNKEGKNVITPAPDYKWNNLGGLYQSFYDKYANDSIETLIELFNQDVHKIIQLVESYNDQELFEQGGSQWASSTPSNWPIWKWIHINTVAPFKTFRTKIRKWKKIKGYNF
ncbi:ClbS/DfsB family four-helix bundle protein [Weizmannia sp. FSL W8-0676]|uniref:ClbS/DfsB family four-helix bundle protein n=1 Tax=Weizmannia sp. FSL W8-0676 TaxID=2954703 RepID=UPI00315851E9